eukprot:1153289-Pelagomonas_calceolata.AAC.3
MHVQGLPFLNEQQSEDCSPPGSAHLHEGLHFISLSLFMHKIGTYLKSPCKYAQELCHTVELFLGTSAICCLLACVCRMSLVQALPEHRRQQYEDPQSYYNFGWSHGKEALQSGHPDTHKVGGPPEGTWPAAA